MEALGLIEVISIARGYEVTDVMAKAADVVVLASRTICSGKHFTMVTGSAGSVRASVAAGRELAAEALVDELELAQVHPSVVPAMVGQGASPGEDAVGIIETFTVAAGVLAADTAVKGAEVKLVDLRLSIGIGGKSYVVLTGALEAVKSGVAAGADLVGQRGLLAGKSVIAHPFPHLKDFLV